MYEIQASEPEQYESKAKLNWFYNTKTISKIHKGFEKVKGRIEQSSLVDEAVRSMHLSLYSAIP